MAAATTVTQRMHSRSLQPNVRTALVQEFLKQQFMFRQNAAMHHGLPMPQDLTVVVPEEEAAPEADQSAAALSRLADIQEQTLQYQRDRDELERQAAEAAAREELAARQEQQRAAAAAAAAEKVKAAEAERDRAKAAADAAAQAKPPTSRPTVVIPPSPQPQTPPTVAAPTAAGSPAAAPKTKTPWYKTMLATVIGAIIAGGGLTAGGLWGGGYLDGDEKPVVVDPSTPPQETPADKPAETPPATDTPPATGSTLTEEQILAMLRNEGFDMPPALGEEILKAFQLDPGFRSRFLGEVRTILEQKNNGNGTE